MAELTTELAEAPTGGAPSTTVYRIRAGDTLGSLARAFSDEDDYLARLSTANPQLEDPDLLTIGQPITVPPASAPR